LTITNLVIFAGLLYYLYVNADHYLGLMHLSVSGIIFLFLLSTASPFFNGLINTYLFQSLGVAISMKDGYYLAAASTLANELPISGGIIVKGYYLKKMHNLSYAKYFSASLAFFVCIVAVNGGIGLAILAFWALFNNYIAAPLLWIGFGLMTSVVLIFFFPFNFFTVPGKLKNWIDQFLAGWLIFSGNPQLLLTLVFFQTCLMIVFAVRYWLAFHMVSQNVTFIQTVLFSSASFLTLLASFAPGGLGVREAIVGALSAALGFSLEGSVAAVGLDRLVSIIVTVIIGWRSIIVLSKKMKESTEIDN
jgi:uncharacterized membrane protein YbhN (UPF0104 family)